MASPNPTPERIRELLHYDPATGIFTATKASGRRYRKKATVGTTHAHGYLTICIDYKPCLAHRVAWAYMTGEWPTHQIDHIDRDKSNNRFDNLRDVPQAANLQNRAANKNRASQWPIGVYYDKRLKKFRARLGVGGKEVFSKTVNTIEEAINARRDAEIRYHNYKPT